MDATFAERLAEMEDNYQESMRKMQAEDEAKREALRVEYQHHGAPPLVPVKEIVPTDDFECQTEDTWEKKKIEDLTEALEQALQLAVARENDEDAPVDAAAVDAALVRNDKGGEFWACLLYTSPSPRDQRGSRMPSSA